MTKKLINFFFSGTTAGNVGLALTQVFELAFSFEFCIKIWAEIETSMTSVERALEYTNVDQEVKCGKTVENWPSDGSISFKEVTLRYNACRNPVLKKLSFDVKPKENIGIIGRTGAGKSSIISVLYRLYEFDGHIEIDGRDIKTLGLEFFR